MWLGEFFMIDEKQKEEATGSGQTKIESQGHASVYLLPPKAQPSTLHCHLMVMQSYYESTKDLIHLVGQRSLI